MRVWNKLALAALVAVSSTSADTLLAQQSAPGTPAIKVAVVDIGYIVKNHPAIKQQQTMMRNQVKATQEELLKRRDALVKSAERLKDLKEGSAEFNQLQEQLAKEEAQLKLDSVRKEKEMDEIGSKMAIDFYNKLQVVITQFAEYNDFDVVLQCSREKPDAKQPASIQMALEKNVVYFKDKVDLTDAVLARIVADEPAAASPTPNTVAPKTATQPSRSR